MPDTAELRNPDIFDTFKLYFRTRKKNTKEYREFVKRTGREPNVIYPDGWFDSDIDRILLGTAGVFFGMQEFKHTEDINTPYEWNDEEQRKYIQEKLKNSDFLIDVFRTNFTLPDVKGVLNDWNVAGWVTKYKEYLIQLKKLKINTVGAGKGVFLYVFYTDNLEYFCPINFSGSKTIFGKNGSGIRKNELQYRLEYAGKKIEPCFDEFLLFLVEAYIRQDFQTLYKYLSVGSKRGLIQYSEDWQEDLSASFIDKADAMCRWDAVTCAMEWVLDCIHFDTIVSNHGNQKKETKYDKFVSLVRTGNIAKYIKKTVWSRIKQFGRAKKKQ